MSDLCTVHGYVSGKVQGVWFRAFTKERAEERQVAGWAKNLGDGRVEFKLSGKIADVEAVVDTLKLGPPMSVVDGLDHMVVDYEPLNGFSIL